MKNIPMKALAVAALLGAAGTPLAAMAQNAGEAPPATAEEPARPMPGPAAAPHGRPDAFRLDIGRPGPGGMSPALGLSAHLAATETYLGITGEQQDAWRDYSQALIAFIEPPAADARAEGDERPADQARPLAAERMAQHALARAEKARALLAATTALRGTLEPAQLERLQQVDPGFGPGPHGPRHEGPERQQPGPRHQPAPAR
ncbi:Spy/CpxP family protein refolding chaperone [Paracoccus denitrificans]|uniref:Spy/CpxP family protein refolding chaperone n=1 Tax=Paracoccus denitrificans TaxID=266 RepID=UPI001E33EA08|nr:Spy/CpxP family protein refolding chaperone [Paracoccus denitrificans]UFS67463.1 Spy/CpxP family protein refolding chaperone [Paracoccus denitrificans]